MNTDNIVLKIKLSEKLNILNVIIIGYTLFLLILGAKTSNSELIIQTCIMGIICILFEHLNEDFLYIEKEGIKSKKFKNILWEDIDKVKRKNKYIFIYTKSKLYKIKIRKDEDVLEVSKAYKYMLSKI